MPITVSHEIRISEIAPTLNISQKALPGDCKEQPPLGMAWID